VDLVVAELGVVVALAGELVVAERVVLAVSALAGVRAVVAADLTLGRGDDGAGELVLAVEAAVPSSPRWHAHPEVSQCIRWL
jgi:hypothetical protein